MCAIKRWCRRKEARPQEILAAALQLFIDKGFAATKIEDIAKAAGVTRGTPYLYFSSKEDIFKSVVTELLLPQVSKADSIIDGWAGSARDLLQELLAFWWTQMGETQLGALPKLMIAEGGNFPEVAALYREQFIGSGNALIRRVIELGVARDEFVVSDPDYATHILAAPVVMAMIQLHSGHCLPEPLDQQRYLDSVFELFLNGIMKRA